MNAFLFIKPSSADRGLIQLFIYFPFKGAGEMYYYVVFNGFHVTEQKITSYSKNDKVCFYTSELFPCKTMSVLKCLQSPHIK